MRKKINKRKQDLPLPFKNFLWILLSGAIGIAVTLSITVIIALILKGATVLPDSLNLLLSASVMLGALITGFIASKQCTFKGIISGLISSLPYQLFILIILLFFSKGKISENILLIFIGASIFSALGGIISANTKRRK